jgi:indolepyruvate ferredoxin oxidoreductase, beta subunit
VESEAANMRLGIVCTGIGGRGVLLASTIILEAAVKAGYRAMASDEYGMSQRGGSVVSLLKIGDFRSPLIGSENADILLAFEESEFYRALPFLRKGGLAIINTDRLTIAEPVAELLEARDITYFPIDADRLAKERGMIQASNMAVLGFFASLGIRPYSPEIMEETIADKVPVKVRDKNLEIFRQGCTSGEGLHIKGFERERD